MRLSRFLIAGVLVPVVLGTNDATAEVCNGRFYIGVNFGPEFGKMKYSSKPGDQYDVVPDNAVMNDIEDTPIGPGVPAHYIVLEHEQTVVKLSGFPKKKVSFTGDVEVGYVFEVKDFGVGLGLNFGKRFGTVLQKENAKLLQYTTVSDAKPIIYDYTSSSVPLEHNIPLDHNQQCKYAGRRNITLDNYAAATKYNTKDVTEIKLKNKFNVTITPIIEYKANSMFGIYITGGIRISNDKVTYKETDGATKKVANFKKTKTTIAPVVGGGIMINLTDHMYAKVQYLYQFGSKIKKTISRKINDKKNEVTPTVKYRSQKVTVGFGYMF